MADTETAPVTTSAALQDEPGAAYGIGWKIFTGSMLLLSSIFTMIFSIVAISDAGYFRTIAVANTRLPTESTIETWGWIGLVVSLVVIIAGFAVFWGTTWARVVGIGAGILNILVHLRFSTIYPYWSVGAIVLSVMVIYGLVMKVRPLTPEQQAELEGRLAGSGPAS
jgi:hypothetical protein